jgi:hypothetical protein
MEWLKFRASACAPLFTGEDGLTDKQEERLSQLLAKEKRTALQEQEMLDLISKRDSEPELPKGAKTYVEGLVDQHVYNYYDSIDNKYTRKGLAVEDSEEEDINKSAIKIASALFFTDYSKSSSYLSKGYFHGHPDIEDEDEQMIIDIKPSWNKKTFPTRPEDGHDSTYEWQGKLYCHMKGWKKFRLCYVLMSTPEELVPDNENDSLHYCDDLPLNLRVTYLDYELTDKDIDKIERREKAAVKYAEEYYKFLINKNK